MARIVIIYNLTNLTPIIYNVKHIKTFYVIPFRDETMEVLMDDFWMDAEDYVDHDEFTLSANELSAKKFLESVQDLVIAENYYNGVCL